VAALDNTGAIAFLRNTGAVLQRCHACILNEGQLAKQADALMIDMEHNHLILCTFHEGMLLEKLLTNYLKRIKRPKSVGFLGPIKKEEEKKDA
jgi:hypothetical protein